MPYIYKTTKSFIITPYQQVSCSHNEYISVGHWANPESVGMISRGDPYIAVPLYIRFLNGAFDPELKHKSHCSTWSRVENRIFKWSAIFHRISDRLTWVIHLSFTFISLWINWLALTLNPYLWFLGSSSKYAMPRRFEDSTITYRR